MRATPGCCARAVWVPRLPKGAGNRWHGLLRGVVELTMRGPARVRRRCCPDTLVVGLRLHRLLGDDSQSDILGDTGDLNSSDCASSRGCTVCCAVLRDGVGVPRRAHHCACAAWRRAQSATSCWPAASLTMTHWYVAAALARVCHHVCCSSVVRARAGHGAGSADVPWLARRCSPTDVTGSRSHACRTCTGDGVGGW